MQIRLTVETDYESVLRIMNQVQDIHVELCDKKITVKAWRIYFDE